MRERPWRRGGTAAATATQILAHGVRLDGGRSVSAGTVTRSLEELSQEFRSGVETVRGGSLQRFREDAYENHATAYRCINLRMQLGAAVPFVTFRRQKTASPGRAPGRKRERQAIGDRPIHQTLKRPYPGKYNTWGQFLQTILGALDAGGNAWVEKGDSNSYGVPRSLTVHTRKHVTPEIDGATNELTGWTVRRGRQRHTFKPEELLHLKYQNPSAEDQILGLAPIHAAQPDIDRDFALRRHDAGFFLRGGVGPVAFVYKPPQTGANKSLILHDDVLDAVRQGYRDKHEGADRSHNLMLVHGGFELTELGANTQDLVSLDGPKWTKQQVAMVYGVSSRLLNDLEGQGFSREALGDDLYALYILAILPVLEYIGPELHEFLVAPYEPELEGEFDASGVKALADDLQKRIEAGKGLDSLGYPPNAINDALDLGMEPLEWGDESLVTGVFTTARAIVEAAEEGATFAFGSIDDPKGIAGQQQDPNAEDPHAEPPPPGAKPGAKDDEKPGGSKPKEAPPNADNASKADEERASRVAALEARMADPMRTAMWQQYVANWNGLRATFLGRLRGHFHRMRTQQMRRLRQAITDGRFVRLQVAYARAAAAAGVPNDLADFAARIRSTPEAELTPAARAFLRGISDDLDAIDFKAADADEKLQRLSEPFFREALSIGSRDVAQQINRPPVGIESAAGEQFLRYKRMKIVETNHTLRRQVRERVRDATLEGYAAGDSTSDLAERLQRAVSDIYDFAEKRARTIARTEIGETVSNGKLIEMAEQGVRKHEWLSARDDVVRRPPAKGGHSKFDHWIDGEQVPLDTPFSNGLRNPNDPDADDPGNVINCRCTTVPVVDDSFDAPNPAPLDDDQEAA